MKSPFTDNETFGTDNAFDYHIAGNADLICPRFAHIRKTNPRSDLVDAFGRPSLDEHRILRSGIPYGPEFDDKPVSGSRTDRCKDGKMLRHLWR